MAHRLAWLYVYGCWPDEIDHINQIRDDNRIANLRSVDRTTNCQNASRQKSESGVTGLVKRYTGKWEARIQVNKKYIYLGIFSTKSEAIAARKAANVKYGFHENHGK